MLIVDICMNILFCVLVLAGEEVGTLFGHCDTGFKLFKNRLLCRFFLWAPAKVGHKLLYRLQKLVKITVEYFHAFLVCIIF